MRRSVNFFSFREQHSIYADTKNKFIIWHHLPPMLLRAISSHSSFLMVFVSYGPSSRESSKHSLLHNVLSLCCCQGPKWLWALFFFFFLLFLCSTDTSRSCDHFPCPCGFKVSVAFFIRICACVIFLAESRENSTFTSFRCSLHFCQERKYHWSHFEQTYFVQVLMNRIGHLETLKNISCWLLWGILDNQWCAFLHTHFSGVQLTVLFSKEAPL